MAEPIVLDTADPVLVALLRDVADNKVSDDDEGTPRLLLDGEPRADVRHAVWAMERGGWAEQDWGATLWRPTARGRAVLEEAGRD